MPGFQPDHAHPVVGRQLASLAHAGFAGEETALLREIDLAVCANPAMTHNPEVGFTAYVLTQSPVDAATRCHYLRLLAVQLGCRGLDTLRLSPFHVIRCWAPDLVVYERESLHAPFRANAMTNRLCRTPSHYAQPLLVAIRARHFRDMDMGTVWDTQDPSCTEADLHAVEQALHCLYQTIDRALEAQFCRVIRRVLVSCAMRAGVRHSFNLRMAYPGVLFIDPAKRPALLVAEDLLHEFMHQALWLNAALGHDTPLATDWSVSVHSPFTERPRPLPVMAHAALIYNAAGLLLASQTSSAHWSPACAQRLRAIDTHLPVLRARLQACDTASPAVTQLLKFLENPDVAYSA